MSKFRCLFFLSLILFLPFLGFSQSSTSQDNTEVSFYVRHGQMMEIGEPGFHIVVENWIPNGLITIDLVDSEGTVYTIISEKSQARAANNGTIWLEVPYLLYDWSRGPCVMLASGKNGVHYLESEIPEVIHPTEENPKWGLNFYKAPQE